MTLTEAARSGRPFFRASSPDTWFYLHVEPGAVVCRRGTVTVSNRYTFNPEELLANDWEPEPIKMELSYQDFIEATRAILQNNPQISQRRMSLVEHAKLLAEQLGLVN